MLAQDVNPQVHPSILLHTFLALNFAQAVRSVLGFSRLLTAAMPIIQCACMSCHMCTDSFDLLCSGGPVQVELVCCYDRPEHESESRIWREMLQRVGEENVRPLSMPRFRRQFRLAPPWFRSRVRSPPPPRQRDRRRSASVGRRAWEPRLFEQRGGAVRGPSR